MAEDIEATPIAARPPPAVPEEPDVSRAPAVIASVATAVLLGATIFSAYKYYSTVGDAADWGRDRAPAGQVDPQVRDAQGWRNLSFGLAVSTVIAGGVTGYLWSRHERSSTINIEPTNSSIRVSYNASF
jgi:hypothetical protein